MKRRREVLLLWALGLLVALPAAADDVTGAKLLLCSVVEVTHCPIEGQCESGPPWRWNIPQFIVADTSAKELRTTRASGENRSTLIRTLERMDGHLLLQGYQGGRAFSLVITENTGSAAMSVTTQRLTISAFGACTPTTD